MIIHSRHPDLGTLQIWSKEKEGGSHGAAAVTGAVLTVNDERCPDDIDVWAG